jgi:aspartyl-tRNA(Asn)/glutamyl-tRNA(Gln) amidotransferase subunit A
LNTLRALKSALASGKTTSEAVVAQALARATDLHGEGRRVFVSIDVDAAFACAREVDRDRMLAPASPLRGVPVSVKDLLDVRGQVTRGASAAMADMPAARADARVIKRLRAAGAVLVGRTNMSEFAFSAVGTNPTFGTPRNPYDRGNGRIPGGSSSGAAVSVTDGMAAVAIGSDTGGSVRIPAALCGLAGFKPTQARVPVDGVLPLSPTLDSIGPIAPRLLDCAIMDGILANDVFEPRAVELRGLAFALPRDVVLDDLEAPVQHAFGRAVDRLRSAGSRVVEVDWPELLEIRGMLQAGSIVAAEAYAWHRARLQLLGDKYDPRVRERLEIGARMSAADYLDWLAFRGRLARSAKDRLGDCAAWIMPTVPIVAPAIRALESDAALWSHVNGALLRNPMIANLIDGCALTLPCHAPGAAPVGVMLTGIHRTDRDLLALGLAIEKRVAPSQAHDGTTD